jgi:transcriptional regulator with XRE-family HTH domain
MAHTFSFMPEFGRRLREERNRLGLTQDALAQLIGVSKGTYYTYEKDLFKPNIDVLAKLAEQGVDMVYVLFNERVSPTGYISIKAFHQARYVLRQKILAQGGTIDVDKLDAMLMGFALQHEYDTIQQNTHSEGLADGLDITYRKAS